MLNPSNTVCERPRVREKQWSSLTMRLQPSGAAIPVHCTQPHNTHFTPTSDMFNSDTEAIQIKTSHMLKENCNIK